MSIEFLGRLWSEETLLRLTCALEQALKQVLGTDAPRHVQTDLLTPPSAIRLSALSSGRPYPQ